MKGRPPGGNDRNLSDSLLFAAESGLDRKSHLDLTSREIATKADTHAGMVNYYFQGKEGLLSALVDTVVTDISHHLQEAGAGIDSNAGDPTELIVRGLVDACYPHAGVVSVVLIEIFRPNSPIRQHYLQRHNSNFVHLEGLIQKLVARGTYRQGLDTMAAAKMLLCLVIGPLILASVWQAGGASNDAPGTEAWICEVVRLLRKEFLATPHMS